MMMISTTGEEDVFSFFSGDDIKSGIYECSWDGSKWSIKQPRFDKQRPNFIDIVLRTVSNLQEDDVMDTILKYLEG
jgi:hypothetical protein